MALLCGRAGRSAAARGGPRRAQTEKHYVDAIRVETTACAGARDLPEAPLRIGARANLAGAGNQVGDWGSSNLDEFAQFSGDVSPGRVCHLKC